MFQSACQYFFCRLFFHINSMTHNLFLPRYVFILVSKILVCQSLALLCFNIIYIYIYIYIYFFFFFFFFFFFGYSEFVCFFLGGGGVVLFFHKMAWYMMAFLKRFYPSGLVCWQTAFLTVTKRVPARSISHCCHWLNHPLPPHTLMKVRHEDPFSNSKTGKNMGYNYTAASYSCCIEESLHTLWTNATVI